MNKLHDFWRNTIRPRRQEVTDNPNPPPKTRNKKHKYECVEFTRLSVNGVGDRCAGVVLDTILVPKFKNTPKIYVVLVCSVNNQYNYQQSYIKYINACYCTPSKTNISISKIPKHKLEFSRK